MRFIGLFAICILLIFSQGAYAIHHRVKEAHADSLQQHDLLVSGYVNGSYNYLSSSPYFISHFFDREFDIAKNGLRLQQAYLTVSSMREGLGGFFSMVTGLDAYSLAPNGWNANVFHLDNVGLTVVQAYLQYRYNDYTVLGGLVPGFASFESEDYRQDSNFSRSILDLNAEPGQHSGVRVIRRINDRMGVIAGLANGWDTIHQMQKLNTLEVDLTFDKTDLYSMMLTGYLGPEYLTDTISSGTRGVRGLLVFFGSYQVTKPLSLAWSVDYGMQSKAALPYHVTNHATWAGVEGYINYKFNECWRTSLRSEIFNDSDGYRTGVRQNLKEVTLTLGMDPMKHLSLMLETRHDFSNVNAFANKHTVGGNPNQQSYALEALYNFD